MAGRLKIHFGLVCDEVRREDNGKLIVIGAYGSSLIPSAVPANLLLSVLVSLEAAAGPAALDFQVLHGDKVIAKGTGTFQFESAGQTLFAIPKIGLREVGEGLLRFELRQAGDKWQPLCSIPVVPPKA